jgi:hypothetical protein
LDSSKCQRILTHQSDTTLSLREEAGSLGSR